MSTVLQFGPADHGRLVGDDDAEGGSFDEGYRYEVIDGRLYVSPQADQPHDWHQRDLFGDLFRYADAFPQVLDCVTTAARVFVPGRVHTTATEPDIAAYRRGPRRSRDDWKDYSPVLVVEVLSGDTAEKDLVRNLDLYFRVPSIEEYWIPDVRDLSNPSMIVHRRGARGWKVLHVALGETYTTSRLPGFAYAVKADAE
jgi:Uma2 family endonuclease